MPRNIAGLFAPGLVLTACLAASPSFAGDSNSVSILQSGSNNSLFTDQSNASGSLLGLGTNPLGDSIPLTQSGNDNSATIIVNGGPASSSASSAIGSAFLQQGTLTEPGSGNTANITVNGVGSLGSIVQLGNKNEANLAVSDGAHGTIKQIGNENKAGLSLSGNALSVTYVQQGNNLTTGPGITVTSTSISGMPTGVTTNGTLPTITITQTK